MNGPEHLRGAAVSDPQWLYSTCAQAAAALVAIVGAFLVTNIANRISDRDGLSRAIAALSDEKTDVEEDLAPYIEARREVHKPRIKGLQDRLRELDREIRLRQYDLDRVGVTPRVVIAGVWVLAGAALAAVLFPVSLIAFLDDRQLAAAGWRAVALGAFSFGLALVLVYVVILASSRRTATPED